MTTPSTSLEWLAPGRLIPNPRNARTHSKKQLRAIAASIAKLGFNAPIIVDEANVVLAGHGRLEAAKLLGLNEVPVLRRLGLSPAQKRAYMIADNKLTERAGWNCSELVVELSDLADALMIEGLDFDLSITGFEPAEIDLLKADLSDNEHDPADDIDKDALKGPPISRAGDLWLLGEHRLLCGDARSAGDLDRLMDGRRAAAVFTDPPYNVAIRGVVGRGRIKHREFAMASGELSDAEFVAFLREALGQAIRVSKDGAVHYVCMDWRHIGHLLQVAEELYGAVLNLCVWAKTNAGQGSFYRSQHELIGVFRVGRGEHQNNVELGRFGRNRSNVWTYAGVNSFGAGRQADLGVHPTVKPVALIADALRDCTKRGDLILDPFVGSGSTLLAAERVGRRACAIEIDPVYVDVAVRRWQAYTGRDAIHAETGLTFDEMHVRRCADSMPPTPTAAAQESTAGEATFLDLMGD